MILSPFPDGRADGGQTAMLGDAGRCRRRCDAKAGGSWRTEGKGGYGYNLGKGCLAMRFCDG